MKNMLDQLRVIDAADIFSQPVTKEEAPDYHDVVKKPMDFKTMEDKLNSHLYKYGDIKYVL